MINMICKECNWKTTEEIKYCEKCGSAFPIEKPWWEKGLSPYRKSKIKIKKVSM